MTDQRVPLFDIRLSDADIRAVEECLRSGWLTMGPRIQEFEQRFAEHLGVKHAIALSSATSALHLAYLAAGVGPGDEVIVPAITFVATANAARYCGATPVLAEVVGREDYGLDPDDVEARITERTKAVCVVHYAGYAGDVERLKEICDRHGLALIEDAAHSPSATPAGETRMLGSFGKAAAFSFFSNKVLSCGEGGLLATDDDDVAADVRSRRSHAMTSGTWDRHKGHSLSYDVVGLGYNYRMDEPRAALLLSRLDGLGEDIAARRRLTHRYRELLAGLEGVRTMYRDDEVDASSCYIMPLTLDHPELQGPLRQRMADDHQIQTSLLYPSIAEFTAYRDAIPEELPRSATAARTQVTVPLFPHMSHEQQDRVVAALSEGLEALR